MKTSLSTTCLITDEVWDNEMIDKVKKSNVMHVVDDEDIVHSGYQANGLVLTDCLETFIFSDVPAAGIIAAVMPAVRTCHEVDRPVGCLSCIGKA